MTEAKEREFATVDEIFEAYIPDFEACLEEPPDQARIYDGSELAAELLEVFERDIKVAGRGGESRRPAEGA